MEETLFGEAPPPPPPPDSDDSAPPPPPPAATETTTVWEFLFPEIKKETAKASQNVREDLSTFLSNYARHLDDLYQAIDQNPCRTWGSSSTPVGLEYPFPVDRAIDEFFEGHTDELIYTIKLLTQFILYIDNGVKRAETEFYPQLAIFGETVEDITAQNDALNTECGIPTGDLEVMMSKALPILQSIAQFMPEYFSVGHRFVEYMIFLYSTENPFFKDFFQSTVFASAFSAIGRLLRVLYTLSTLISENPALSEGWEHIRRMAFVIKNDPGQYNTQETDVNEIDTQLSQIHRIVFCGDLIPVFFNSLMDLKLKPTSKHFTQQLERYLDEEISQYTRLVKTGKYSELEVNICNITLLYHLLTYFSPTPKKDIISKIWNTYNIAAVVKLYHFVAFSPILYLKSNIAELTISAVGESKFKGIQQQLLQTMQAHDSALGTVSNQVFAMFSQWQAVCHTQLVKGLEIANFLKAAITRTIDLHSSFNKPIDYTNTAHLGRMIELLKAVQITFFLNQSTISHNQPSAVENVIKNLDEELKKVARNMRKKAYKQFRTRASNITSLAHHCIRFFSSEYSGPCLNVLADLFSSKALSGLGFTRSDIYDILRKLDMLQHYNKNIDQACNCSFMVDSRDLFSLFLRFIRTEPRRILFLAQAMNDVGETVKHDPELSEKFENCFIKTIREGFISPILSQIETELRFHSHQHLAVSERNPLKKQFSNFDKFLQIPPFKLMSRFIDIQYEASYYFSRVFYNEITVAPQVWETYAEMSNLANRLYGIKILDCHIPGAMMQQDIDVLEIMRNINVFVACYNYDLNSQVFVQRAEDSHHVSIVGIPHIFSSYRCHGIGIMNTTVDFTYRFLRSKFNVFSKFLFDDTVRSKLVNDISWFETNKDGCEGLWPYDRANKLVDEMKRIGNAAGQQMSPLDHFRILITEIGNALGFVRMVKSGGTRFLNNAIGFVYDENEDLSFHQFAEEVQLQPATMDATARLDSVVQKLKELFNGGTSFFTLLIDVFSGPFRDKKNSHLHTFYAIVPALTLSYIEHIAVLKDKAQKQNKNASFSDDGFPMGLAYILKLLDQDALFDSIHWFQSLRKHSEAEKQQNLEASQTGGRFFKKDNKQTLKLALQMIEKRLHEFQLLETTVHSARILFN